MNYEAMTIEELQRLGTCGDERAILELGRKVLDFDISEGSMLIPGFCDECGGPL